MLYFVLYSPLEINKRQSDLISYIFIKMIKKNNVTLRICFQLFQIPKQIHKTLTFSLKVFDIDRFLKTKHLEYTFVLCSTCQTIKDNLIGSLLYFYKNEEEKCHFRDLFSTFTYL